MTLEFREFIDSLNRGDDDTPVPQMHGRNVMAILDAWEQSHASGKEVNAGHPLIIWRDYAQIGAGV